MTDLVSFPPDDVSRRKVSPPRLRLGNDGQKYTVGGRCATPPFEFLANWLVLGLALVLGACRGCSGASSVGGETPYVRCLAGPAPSPRAVRVGKSGLQIRDRVLVVTPPRASWTLAAFAGPGLGVPPTAAAASALMAAQPDLLLLLGDLGDSPVTAKATLATLAAVPAPTLLIGGGRDSPARIADAIAALRVGKERVIDTTGLREIRIGSDTLIPVAGALDGRYALEERTCGYALEDLKRFAKEVSAVGPGRRWLLAWEAPGLGGVSSVSRTDQGVDVGSPALAQLGLRLGAPGGLFAWPHVQAGRPTSTGGNARPAAGEPAKDFQLVVPRLSGPAVERGDGSTLPPGFALLTLDASGLALTAMHEIP